MASPAELQSTDSSASRLETSDASPHPFSRLRRGLLLGLGMAGSGLLGACASGADEEGGMPVFRLDARTTVTAQRLDEEVARAFPLFNAGPVLPGFDATALGARNDVVLYRLTTTTTIPETGEAVQVTGLLALPAGASGTLPVVSWQHGTILSFDQVPSNLTKLADPAYALSDEADSLETLFNVHRFAANGFAVIAADYIGKGPLRNGRGEGYVVKGVTTATCVDMLQAGLAALRSLQITPGKLFLHGWSQGSLNTQWLHQSLRGSGRKIAATAVASPFSDVSLAWSYWTGRVVFPVPAGETSYPEVPGWVALCMIIMLGSYETYYRIDGLIESAVRPQYRQMARKYWNDYLYDADSVQPTPTTTDLLVPDFHDPQTDPRNRRFLQQAAENGAMHWQYDSPIRFHIGLADEATHPDMTARTLAAVGPQAHGVQIAGASHRATFLAGLYGDAGVLEGNGNILSWFDGLARRG